MVDDKVESRAGAGTTIIKNTNWTVCLCLFCAVVAITEDSCLGVGRNRVLPTARHESSVPSSVYRGLTK